LALDVVGYRPPRVDAALGDGLCAVDELPACEDAAPVASGPAPPVGTAVFVDGIFGVPISDGVRGVTGGKPNATGDGLVGFSGFVATDDGVVWGAAAVFLLVAANAVASVFMPGPVFGPVAAVAAAASDGVDVDDWDCGSGSVFCGVAVALSAACVSANVDGFAAVDGASGLMEVRPTSANASSMPWLTAAARFAASVDGSMSGNNPAGVGWRRGWFGCTPGR